MKDEYMYMPFPWLSKSSFKKYLLCPYKFKRQVIDGEVPNQTRWMAQGTGTHLIFYSFFDQIDFDTLWELEWHVGVGTTHSPVYRYFLSTVLNFVQTKITNSNLTNNIRNFCMFEENHYVSIRSSGATKKETRDSFITPVAYREYFIMNEKFKMFGTVDRKIIENNITLIIDWKTGSRGIPKELISEIREGPFTKAKLTHYVKEGNYYCILQALVDGYDFVRIADKNGVMVWEMVDKDGRKCSSKFPLLYNYAFIFTGYYLRPHELPRAYVARKKANMVSARSILDTIEKIQSTTDFYRDPNLIRCMNCELYTNECRDEVPFEIYGNLRRGEDTPSEDFHNDG